MLKSITAILIALHLLPGIMTSNPSQSSTDNIQVADITVKDKVYADLALQHELNHVSLYYFDNNPRNTISIDPDKNWDPASTIKLFVAMYAFDQISHGKIYLDENITIDSKNVAPSLSYENGYPPLNIGEDVTVFRLVDQMITQSDNTAYNTLLDILNRVEVTKYIHDLGLVNSSVGSKLNLSDDQLQYEYTSDGYGPNLITADDYAKAFILINGGRLAGSDDLFNILSHQKLNSMLPALLPDNVTVAHKTGELAPYYHDGGIIADPTSKRRYVLSVFSDLGNPLIVAHLSNLVYSDDINIVGNNLKHNLDNSGEDLNRPVDPLVTENFVLEDAKVLAAAAQNVVLPKITAADIGMEASDLSNTLDLNKELPPVIIPADSPLHFWVELAENLRIQSNPIPTLRTQFATENLKLNLAEANNLLKRGKISEANTVLQKLNSSLPGIADDNSLKNNVSLQNSVDQVSETRFDLLKSELQKTEDENQKAKIVKEIASQAENTIQNVKPALSEALKNNDLSQSPITGEVVAKSPTSITIQEDDGTKVVTPLNNFVKTRDVNENTGQVININDIAIGTNIAIAGENTKFILTNLPDASINTSPVTVVKVNEENNTLVVITQTGVTQQINLTSDTVLKGRDTTISLNEIKAGDIVVVHGVPIPLINKSPDASPSGVPIETSAPENSEDNPSSSNNSELPQPVDGSGVLSSPLATIIATPRASFTPLITATPSSKPSTPQASNKATKTASPKPSTPTPAPAVTKKETPKVIKGNVIEVVKPVTTTPALPVPSTPAPQKATTPVPPTPVPTTSPAPKK